MTEAELDAGFDELEIADRAITSDLGFVGVAVGMGVAQQVVPNMTVRVIGPGVVYDQTGQRIAIPSTQNVNCAVDENALSTDPTNPGDFRILSVFAEFDRTLTDPRVDGNSATVYFVRSESFQFNVAMSASDPAPTPPALRGDQILLADITIAFGASTIVTGDISETRREWAFKTTSGTAVAVGTAEEAVQALADAIEDLSLAEFPEVGGTGGLPEATAQNQIIALWRRSRVRQLFSLHHAAGAAAFASGAAVMVRMAAGGTAPKVIVGITTKATVEMAWSIDGHFWTVATGGFPTAGADVVWNGSLFVAVGEGGLAEIGTSTDGKAWTARTSTHDVDAGLSVAWGASIFVSVGGTRAADLLNVNRRIESSPDGVTWTNRTNPVAARLTCVHFANAIFVAVGNAGTVITSPDGVTWTDRTAQFPFASDLRSVTYDAKAALWIAVGNDGVNMVVYTTPNPNATNWTDRSATIGTVAGDLTDVEYCGEGIVVASSADTVTNDPRLFVTFDAFVSTSHGIARELSFGGAASRHPLLYADGQLLVGGGTNADGMIVAISQYEEPDAII